MPRTRVSRQIISLPEPDTAQSGRRRIGAMGGKRGGPARADKLTAERMRGIAQNAALVTRCHVIYEFGLSPQSARL